MASHISYKAALAPPKLAPSCAAPAPLLCCAPAVGSVNLTVDGGTCQNNSAGAWGGCADMEESSVVTFTGGFRCFDNQATDSGGCIGLAGSAKLNLTGASVVEGNHAGQGGGLYVEGDAALAVTGGSQIVDNTAKGERTGSRTAHLHQKLG